MERKIYAELLEWKDDPDRKPMILLGCRQVGKTFIVMEFGDREYENIAYNQHYIERILNNPKTPIPIILYNKLQLAFIFITAYFDKSMNYYI